jgi:hypothetical protein
MASVFGIHSPRGVSVNARLLQKAAIDLQSTPFSLLQVHAESKCCKCKWPYSLAPGSEIRAVCEQTVRDVCCRAWPWWSQGRFHSGSALYSLPSKLNTADVRVHIPECFMTVSRGRSCVWVDTTNVVNECDAALVRTFVVDTHLWP